MSEEGDNAEGLLRDAINEIMELTRQKENLSVEIRNAYGEIKSAGFDTKIVRKVVARLRRDRQEVEEEDMLIDLYEQKVRNE